VNRCLILLIIFVLSCPALAGVNVFVEEENGLAWLKYECTAGELVRAFALDVTVDKGRIDGVSDFFRGESTSGSQGYGIFPASFRDHIKVESGTNIDWNVEGYTPLAVVGDNPADTLPGLGTSGVTLEFGALWDSSDSLAFPEANGTLCALRISQGALVSVKPNASRGGVVAADADMILSPVFEDAFVQPPEITSLSVSNSLLTIEFAGGELESAPTVDGPWIPSGNISGHYSESLGEEGKMFYRVRNL
jgi:hypothetical protein